MQASQVKNLLANKTVTMAQVQYTTNVKPAAKYKDVVIKKHTSANVQLFSTLKSATVYLNAVKKSANRIEENNKENVAEFQQTETYYEHDDCYSIVRHRKTGKEYLYCIYNNATSEFEIDGKPADRKQVAEYLTPSEAKKLFSDGFTYNKANDVVHDVVVRTIGLDNVEHITACGTTL